MAIHPDVCQKTPRWFFQRHAHHHRRIQTKAVRIRFLRQA
jgi:hypothetical protein